MTLVAAPQCFVNIFPFEGGKYSLVGGQVLECTYTKDIYSNDGTFEIVLSPGGPNTNYGPTWAEILTPMSLVLIGMTRGVGTAEIVCIGVIRRVKERQKWKTDHGTQRVTVVRGSDFSYFFKNFSYTSLYFLGAYGSTVNQGGLGLPQILLGKYLLSTPDQFGKALYNNVMAGASGIMADTYVNYNGQTVSFPKAMGTVFAPYSPGIEILSGYLVTAEAGPWENKFREAVFPFPWYESFVNTAPASLYSGYTGASSGFAFQMPQMPAGVSASPNFVCRPNPLPTVTVTGSGSNFAPSGIDASAWEALPVFETEYNVPLESEVEFSDGETTNFDWITPTWASSAIGGGNADTASFTMLYPGAVDVASIHRYGFKPNMMPSAWFYDPQGIASVQRSQNGGSARAQVLNLQVSLLGRLFSYYSPIPLMARGSVSHWLRPDIQPGCRYRFAPFKHAETYDFYILGVEHRFVFGGKSSTTLTLDRGLPTTVYEDTSSDGLLFNIHIGNAMRKEGQYQIGLPQAGQQGVQIVAPSSFTSIQQVLGEIAQVYVSPQAQ